MRVVAATIHRRLNIIVVVSLQLIIAACVVDASSSSSSSSSSSKASMMMNAVEECDPNNNKAEFRTTIALPNTSSCGPGSHCVLDGNSSLGGYCIDDDHKSVQLYMPEDLNLVCFICETLGQNDGSNRAVKSPDDKVGVFTCGELDGYGRKGSIPKANCHIFQHLIQNNNLCGCFTVLDAHGTTAAAELLLLEKEYMDDDDDDDDETSTPYTPSTGSTTDKIRSFTTTSGSRTTTIATATATATAVSVISMLMLMLC